MKRTIMALMMLVVAGRLVALDSPQVIPFQGRITNQNGETYKDMQYSVIFNLYDSPIGGASLWQERHEKVGAINGMINVFLGSISPFSQNSGVDFTKTLYLGITIDVDGNPGSADPEMVPRQMIIPAFHAKNSEKLQGMDWSAVLSGDASIPLANRYINPDRLRNFELDGNKVVNGTITLEKLAASLAEMLIPTGSIHPFAGSEEKIPNGWLLCDGRTLSTADYPKLYAVIGRTWTNSTVEEEKFSLPDLRNRTLWGADATSTSGKVGAYLEAGLPGIWGTTAWSQADYWRRGTGATGAFWTEAAGGGTDGYDDTDTCVISHFDASRCSPIYGRSATVQPPSACVNFIIKY